MTSLVFVIIASMLTIQQELASLIEQSTIGVCGVRVLGECDEVCILFLGTMFLCTRPVSLVSCS